MKDVIISAYSPEFKTETVGLLKYLWRDLSEKERLNLFEWKYEKNPCEINPCAFVATSGNKVVSFRGWFSQYFYHNAGVFKILSASDAVTHPDYLRKGLFRKLNAASLSHFQKTDDIIGYLNISSNFQSTNGYLNLGWQPIAYKKFYYKVSLPNLIKNHLSNNKKYNLTSFSAHLTKNQRYELTDIIYAEEIATLFEKQRPENSIINQKHKDYIKWRYQNPNARYYFAYLFDNNMLTNFIAFKFLSPTKCSIVDFSYSDFEAFSVLIKLFQRKLKPSVINVFSSAFDESQNCNFSTLGFTSLNKYRFFLRKHEQLPVLFRPNSINCEPKDFIIKDIDFRNIRHWQIFEIDSDGT